MANLLKQANLQAMTGGGKDTEASNLLKTLATATQDLQAQRPMGAGRPKGETQKDQHEKMRTSLWVRKDQLAKIQYLARIHGATFKTFIEALFSVVISNYEAEHGTIEVLDADNGNTVEHLFGKYKQNEEDKQ